MKFRKKFLILVTFLSVILVLNSCSVKNRYSDSQTLLDTNIDIVVYTDNESLANEVIEDAFDEIARIQLIFDPYNVNTEINELNRNKMLNNYSDEFFYVINNSLYFSEISNGSFDVTVFPLLNLYTESFSKLERPPTDEEIGEELRKVGYNNLVIEGNSIYLRNDASITLGGIAKGYAIDKATKLIKSRGIDSAMVNAGGDLRVIGMKPKGEWTIALENPRDGDEYLEFFYLKDVAAATSGDYRRYYSEDYKTHHIMNPKTGKSATELISVTVIGPKAIVADALSTSIFVLGPDKGLEMINSIKSYEALIVTNEKEIIKSDNLKKYSI